MTAVLLLIAFLFIFFSGQPEVMSRGELIQAAGPAGKQPGVQRQHACFKYQGAYSYRQTHLNMSISDGSGRRRPHRPTDSYRSPAAGCKSGGHGEEIFLHKVSCSADYSSQC